MYKFQKVSLDTGKIKIDYDWMLVIDSINDLVSYHKQTMEAQIRPAWDNLFKVQEGKAHINSNLSLLISLHAESAKCAKSLVELTSDVSAEIFSAKADAILNKGKIYVNKNGGFFPHSNDIAILEEMALEHDKLIFPQYSESDILIKRWDGGKHYYAYVGDISVDMYGEQKWNTEKRAMEMAKDFIHKINSENFIIKK